MNTPELQKLSALGLDPLWFQQAYRLMNVTKGTTAQRPSLGATDAGAMYFDTTLAAAMVTAAGIADTSQIIFSGVYYVSKE